MTKRGLPIVHTLNDYKLVCPNYLLYTEGAPCTRCRRRNYFHAVRHRCLHGSLTWSALAAVEMSLHSAWRVYERHVATFIAPSRFVKSTMQVFGVAAHQLRHVPHFFFPQDFAVSQADGDYCAYFGRLSREKGLPTLVRAMRRAPQVQLLVVGEGPMRAPLEQIVAQEKLDNVRFGGYLSGQELQRALGRARFTVLPSEWYEVFGMSIVESFALGKPVVAARIGGIPELIDEGQDGLLFTPGDADELAACLRRLWHDPRETQRMGLHGRRKALARYNPENHYRRLYRLYEKLVHNETLSR
jgi:glycosyltransferase involved in cell wall biosynthesis